MFPEVILDLIDSYVAAMDEGSDLPSLRAVQKLIKRTDLFVMNTLTFVLQLPRAEILRNRYWLELDHNFMFYFQLTPMQRIRLLHLLKNSVATDVHCANLIWLFIIRQPPLRLNPEYFRLFRRSFLCTMIGHLESQ
jgi:hypothetical protein